jgi:hypothetical protein
MKQVKQECFHLYIYIYIVIESKKFIIQQKMLSTS